MSKAEYAHQCRYCAYCVFTIEDSYWCDEKNEHISAPKRPNSCKDFLSTRSQPTIREASITSRAKRGTRHNSGSSICRRIGRDGRMDNL